jgi:aspartyl-tRNA synthetase
VQAQLNKWILIATIIHWLDVTQIDVEMSFIRRRDIMHLMEQLLVNIWQRVLKTPFPMHTPLPVITYHEAMTRYGVDKPGMR